jgi:hypothetical protein
MEVWVAGGGAGQENHGKKTAQNPPGPPQELLHCVQYGSTLEVTELHSMDRLGSPGSLVATSLCIAGYI